jgi:hypothetical protein
MDDDRPARTLHGVTGGMRLAALLLLVSLLQACILPTPSETLHAVPEQAAGAFVPGTSSRADVLLRLGDPSCRGEHDSYFVYEWEKTHGGVVLGYPLPFAGAFEVSCHCLVIRFLPDGLVADLKHFDGDVQWLGFPGVQTESGRCKRDSELMARVMEWLAEPLPERR